MFQIWNHQIHEVVWCCDWIKVQRLTWNVPDLEPLDPRSLLLLRLDQSLKINMKCSTIRFEDVGWLVGCSMKTFLMKDEWQIFMLVIFKESGDWSGGDWSWRLHEDGDVERKSLDFTHVKIRRFSGQVTWWWWSSGRALPTRLLILNEGVDLQRKSFNFLYGEKWYFPRQMTWSLERTRLLSLHVDVDLEMKLLSFNYEKKRIFSGQVTRSWNARNWHPKLSLHVKMLI